MPAPRRLAKNLQENLQLIQKMSPEEAASALLQKHGGDPRAAEVDAWEIYDMAAGGTWGARGKKTEGAANSLEIIRAMLEHLEDPAVQRTRVKHPAYAMRYGAAALPTGGAKNLLSNLAKAAGVKG